MNSKIHPTAIIDPQAELDATVEVGPFAVIGGGVTVGAHTKIGAHAVLEGPLTIGEHNQIFPGAALGLAPQDLKYDGRTGGVRIGHHNILREYVTINASTGEEEQTILGDHNCLMAYSHVAHNCHLQDHIVVANSGAIAGHVVIGSRAVIGGLVGIHQFVHVGQMAMVGGMSKITRDIPPFTMVQGNPAELQGLNVVGLRRAGLSREELKGLKGAYKRLYRSGESISRGLEQGAGLPEFSENPYVAQLETFLRASLQSDRRGPTPARTPKTKEGRGETAMAKP